MNLERLRAAVREPQTRYELVSVAGSGGMGTVYVARDPLLDRRVALKVLDLPDAQLEQRLRREAQILARLEHPGIVPVHEVGACEDGRTYYTMKLVEGVRLDAFRGSLAERLRIFLRIAETVAFAHAHGVLHRDLKPQNVMLGAFGEVLVLDWGLAGADRIAGGTQGFVSPEQARGEEVDARTDVYSLGAMLPQDDARLRAIALKATAARRDDRYDSVAALAQDVARYLEGESLPGEPLHERVARLVRKHRVALGILGAYVAGRALIFFFTRR